MPSVEVRDICGLRVAWTRELDWMIGLLSRTPVHDNVRRSRNIGRQVARKPVFLTSFALVGN